MRLWADNVGSYKEITQLLNDPFSNNNPINVLLNLTKSLSTTNCFYISLTLYRQLCMTYLAL